MTVNIACRDCDGPRPCDACRNAARALTAAGFFVEHSSRYAALRAAASGTYGFDACIVPVEQGERAVVDAAVVLFAGKRLAFVADSAASAQLSPRGITVLPRTRYASGELDTGWLSGAPAPNGVPAASNDETATISQAAAVAQDATADAVDRSRATRRLKRVADLTRAVVAQAGLAATPRLDLLAVLEDEVAWARASGNAFAILLVHLHGISSARGSKPAASIDKRVRDAETTIAGAVRSSDVVAGRGDDFLVVLSEPGAKGPSRAASRVARAVDASGLRAATKTRKARGFATWSIGVASYPDDGSTRDALLARATATLKPIGAIASLKR